MYNKASKQALYVVRKLLNIKYVNSVTVVYNYIETQKIFRGFVLSLSLPAYVLVILKYLFFLYLCV